MVVNVTTLSHGGVMLMLFVIYACHLPASIYCTNYFRGVSSWWECLFDGLTMIDMIAANHMNTIYFLQISIYYK